MGQRRQIILLSVLGMISALANGMIPYVTGRFFDAILGSGRVFLGTAFEVPFWAGLLTLWVVVQMAANTTDWLSDGRIKKMGTLLDAQYVSLGFGHLLLLPVAFHKSKKAGEIGNRITRAGQQLALIFENVIARVGPQLLSVAVGLAVVFSIHWIFGVLMIGGVLCYIGILARVVPPAGALQRKAFKAYGDAYGDLYGGLANV